MSTVHSDAVNSEPAPVRLVSLRHLFECLEAAGNDGSDGFGALVVSEMFFAKLVLQLFQKV